MSIDFNAVVVAQTLLLAAYVVHALALSLAALKVSHWERNRGVRYMTNMLAFTAIGALIKSAGVLYTLAVGHPTAHVDGAEEYTHSLIFAITVFIGQMMEIWFSVAFALYLVGVLNGLINHEGRPPARVTVDVAHDASVQKTDED